MDGRKNRDRPDVRGEHPQRFEILSVVSLQLGIKLRLRSVNESLKDKHRELTIFSCPADTVDVPWQSSRVTLLSSRSRALRGRGCRCDRRDGDVKRCLRGPVQTLTARCARCALRQPASRSAP